MAELNIETKIQLFNKDQLDFSVYVSDSSKNCTTSFGVHSRIRQIFSRVKRVILFPFRRVSSVRLSIPCFISRYCVNPRDFIVSHSGL